MQQTHMTNNVVIAEIKIKHEPAAPEAPLIIISTKEHVHNLISHASLTLGQREEEQLLRFNAIVFLTAIKPVGLSHCEQEQTPTDQNSGKAGAAG